MKLRRTSALAVAGTAALLTLSACGSSPTVNDQKSFSLSGTRLIIDTESDLRLVPGSGADIGVQRWLSGTTAKPGHSSVVVHSGDNNDTVSRLSGSVVIDGGSGQVQLSDTSARSRSPPARAASPPRPSAPPS